MLFLVDELQIVAHDCSPRAQRLLISGTALRDLIFLWRGCEVQLRPNEIQQSFDLWKTFLRHSDDEEGMQQPKRHLGTHLVARLCWHGNPSRYANWLDETLNKGLKASCRTVSQITFEVFSLLRSRVADFMRGVKRKR